MSDGIRSSNEIRADPEGARAVIERARAAFMPIEGVVSVGFGQKSTAGAYRDQIAIAVFVRKKRPLEELAPEERIPPVFEGYPTDVVVIADIAPLSCENETAYELIQGGIQIAPPMRTADIPRGTLGCIVRRRGDASRENVFLLSCRHVLFADGAQAGDYIYHPFPPPMQGMTTPPGPSTSLGPIQPAAFYENRRYRTPGSSADTELFIDCATARLNIDSKCFGSTCTKDVLRYATTIVDLDAGPDDPATPVLENNSIRDVRNVIDDAGIIDQRVYKVGRTTRRTVGIVRYTNAGGRGRVDPDDPDSPDMEMRGLIYIDFDTSSTPSGTNCNGNERFAEWGDSGSIVVDEQGRAIGMITGTARDPAGMPVLPGPAVASHILPVLDALNICIPTAGGTSYGSCAAVDGSGITPAPATAGSSAGGSGIRFTAGALGAPSRIPEPIPITDEERDHMLVLRDALRETAFGREIHECFADVRREIGYLVRNVRSVTVAWHRLRGPAFLVHVLNHLKGATDTVPREIGGVSRSELLVRMGEVLHAHGSNPLRAAIDRFGPVVLDVVTGGDTVHDWLGRLREQSFTAANEVPI